MRFRRRGGGSDAGDQTIEAPNASEREWIEEHVGAASELVRIWTGVEADSPPTPELLDQAFERWLESWLAYPEADRDDPNPYLNVFGLAFGQRLVEDLDLEWKVVTDSAGSEIAVHGQPGDVLVFPPNLVAKRFVARETGFMQPVYDEIAWSVERLRRGEDPTIRSA